MIILFFLVSLIICYSTLGYGILVLKILKFKDLNYNLGAVGFLGLFFLSIISNITHIFVAHDYVHNLIVVIAGLYVLISTKKFTLIQLKFVSIIFALLFISIIMSKTNEDFGYYHLPNSLQFAQQKLQFGLGNLNHGFKHISSLFMLMSLNYLPIFEYYLFNLTNLLFLVFFITFSFIVIYKSFKHYSKISKIILSFFVVLFLIKFSRLAEYGSDISGHIAIIMYLFYLINIIYNHKINTTKKLEYLKLSLIFLTFSITLKFIFIIYALFLIIPFFLLKENFLEIFIKFKFSIIIILPICLFLLNNFSATGCLIYPVQQLCFSEKLEWALDNDTITYLKSHYEAWSKAGIGPGFGVENKENYLTYLNWVPNWFKEYFVGKFSDYILVILVIIFFFLIFFFKEAFFTKNNKKNLENKNFNSKYFYFFIFIIFLFWFFNFPTLRYAGYIVVSLLLIFPFSIILSKKINFENKKNIQKFTIILIISYSVFLFKNFYRIYEELKIPITQYHNFKNFPFYWVKKIDYLKKNINGQEIYISKDSCWNIPSTCVRNLNNLRIEKKNNYIFYLRK